MQSPPPPYPVILSPACCRYDFNRQQSKNNNLQAWKTAGLTEYKSHLADRSKNQLKIRLNRRNPFIHGDFRVLPGSSRNRGRGTATCHYMWNNFWIAKIYGVPVGFSWLERDWSGMGGACKSGDFQPLDHFFCLAHVLIWFSSDQEKAGARLNSWSIQPGNKRVEGTGGARGYISIYGSCKIWVGKYNCCTGTVFNL